MTKSPSSSSKARTKNAIADISNDRVVSDKTLRKRKKPIPNHKHVDRASTTVLSSYALGVGGNTSDNSASPSESNLGGTRSHSTSPADTVAPSIPKSKSSSKRRECCIILTKEDESVLADIIAEEKEEKEREKSKISTNIPKILPIPAFTELPQKWLAVLSSNRYNYYQEEIFNGLHDHYMETLVQNHANTAPGSNVITCTSADTNAGRISSPICLLPPPTLTVPNVIKRRSERISDFYDQADASQDYSIPCGDSMDDDVKCAERMTEGRHRAKKCKTVIAANPRNPYSKAYVGGNKVSPAQFAANNVKLSDRTPKSPIKKAFNTTGRLHFNAEVNTDASSAVTKTNKNAPDGCDIPFNNKRSHSAAFSTPLRQPSESSTESTSVSITKSKSSTNANVKSSTNINTDAVCEQVLEMPGHTEPVGVEYTKLSLLVTGFGTDAAGVEEKELTLDTIQQVERLTNPTKRRSGKCESGKGGEEKLNGGLCFDHKHFDKCLSNIVEDLTVFRNTVFECYSGSKKSGQKLGLHSSNLSWLMLNDYPTHVVVPDNCQRRTLNMLVALSLGVPVVTSAWVWTCLEQGQWIVDSNAKCSPTPLDNSNTILDGKTRSGQIVQSDRGEDSGIKRFILEKYRDTSNSSVHRRTSSRLSGAHCPPLDSVPQCKSSLELYHSLNLLHKNVGSSTDVEYFHVCVTSDYSSSVMSNIIRLCAGKTVGYVDNHFVYRKYSRLKKPPPVVPVTQISTLYAGSEYDGLLYINYLLLSYHHVTDLLKEADADCHNSRFKTFIDINVSPEVIKQWKQVSSDTSNVKKPKALKSKRNISNIHNSKTLPRTDLKMRSREPRLIALRRLYGCICAQLDAHQDGNSSGVNRDSGGMYRVMLPSTIQLIFDHCDAIVYGAESNSNTVSKKVSKLSLSRKEIDHDMRVMKHFLRLAYENRVITSHHLFDSLEARKLLPFDNYCIPLAENLDGESFKFFENIFQNVETDGVDGVDGDVDALMQNIRLPNRRISNSPNSPSDLLAGFEAGTKEGWKQVSSKKGRLNTEALNGLALALEAGISPISTVEEEPDTLACRQYRRSARNSNASTVVSPYSLSRDAGMGTSTKLSTQTNSTDCTPKKKNRRFRPGPSDVSTTNMVMDVSEVSPRNAPPHTNDMELEMDCFTQNTSDAIHVLAGLGSDMKRCEHKDNSEIVNSAPSAPSRSSSRLNGSVVEEESTILLSPFEQRVTPHKSSSSLSNMANVSSPPKYRGCKSKNTYQHYVTSPTLYKINNGLAPIEDSPEW